MEQNKLYKSNNLIFEQNRKIIYHLTKIFYYEQLKCIKYLNLNLLNH